MTTDPAHPADEVHNVRSDDQPPGQRAPIIVAFWEAFPVTTPAQALRRWDGAHTGPLGDRHGLLHILEGARRYSVPVALLDIKNPASLAALNFMGHVPVLQNLSGRSLLILPDVAYAEPAGFALNFSRLAASGFGLPASQFVYITSSNTFDFLRLFRSRPGRVGFGTGPDRRLPSRIHAARGSFSSGGFRRNAAGFHFRSPMHSKPPRLAHPWMYGVP